MAAEGEYPKSDGDIFYASEVNNLHEGAVEVYTNTGFDSSSNTDTPDEQSHELTAVTSTDRDYLKIVFTVSLHSDNFSDCSAIGNVFQLKAQVKETSGAYGDIIAYKEFGGGTNQTSFDDTITYVKKKSNGTSK